MQVSAVMELRTKERLIIRGRTTVTGRKTAYELVLSKG